MIKKIYIGAISGSEYPDENYLKIFDRQHGFELPLCNFFVDGHGNIFETHEIGEVFSEKIDNESVVIRCCDHILNNDHIRSLYGVYAVIFYIYQLNGNDFSGVQILNGSELDESLTLNIDFNKYFGDIHILMEMNKNANDYMLKMQSQIDDAKTLARNLIETNQITSKEDIENSEFYKLYTVGNDRLINILNNHSLNDNEFIVVKEYGNIDEMSSEEMPFIHNSYIHKTIFEFLKKYKDTFNISYLFETIYRESTFFYYSHSIKHENSELLHLIDLFNCWSLIKEIFPTKLTTNVIKRYHYYDNLSVDQLYQLLTAYILLSEEVKTIKDFSEEDIISTIYNKIVSGTYISGQNYEQNGFNINIRNVKLYINRNIAKEFYDA